MTGHSVHTASAFASTFYFFADTQINAKIIKNATYSRHSMTLKFNTDYGLQGRTT